MNSAMKQGNVKQTRAIYGGGGNSVRCPLLYVKPVDRDGLIR